MIDLYEYLKAHPIYGGTGIEEAAAIAGIVGAASSVAYTGYQIANAPKSKEPEALAMPKAPDAPDQEAITRQSQIDTQKANAIRSTPYAAGDTGSGVLTDSNATYQKKTLLGN